MPNRTIYVREENHKFLKRVKNVSGLINELVELYRKNIEKLEEKR